MRCYVVDRFSRFVQPAGELDDPKRILAGQCCDQQDFILSAHVVVHAAQRDSSDCSQYTQRHNQNHSQWSISTFILRREHEAVRVRCQSARAVAGNNWISERLIARYMAV
jgi:hypothetical protein